MSDKIKIGDKVKSHDFPFCREEHKCYIFGIVEAIDKFPELDNSFRYKIRVIERIFDGIYVSNLEEYAYPPINGTKTAFDYICDGVEKVK